MPPVDCAWADGWVGEPVENTRKDEEGTAYVVDLALPIEGAWRPVTFGERTGPPGGLRFAAGAEPEACLRDVPSSEAKRD